MLFIILVVQAIIRNKNRNNIQYLCGHSISIYNIFWKIKPVNNDNCIYQKTVCNLYKKSILRAVFIQFRELSLLSNEVTSSSNGVDWNM